MFTAENNAAVSEPAILVHAPGTAGGQNLLLFRIYLIYRAILSFVFLLLLGLPATRQLVGSESPTIYALMSIAFLVTNAVLLTPIAQTIQSSTTQLVLLFSVDIFFITLLGGASGGMSSGLPLLLTITAASSAVLITNRTIATLVAALAVLAVLGDTLRLVSTSNQTIQELLPAGLLGILIFVVSGIMQLIALRLGRAEAIATERSTDLYRLQRLNEQIVQNMQTGILLIDGDNRARVMNAAAGKLLDPTRPVILEQGRAIEDYSDELARRLRGFRTTARQDDTPFQARAEGAEIVVRFSVLEAGENNQLLGFIEDYRPVAAYAQSLKLSSLGRLAGSIAHEIRNPLGAISHATQLLQESETLGSGDKRMIDMVLTNSQRVNEIVESVLQISRREPPAPERLVMADWLLEYRQLYIETREHPGALFLEYLDPQAIIRFDPEHLQRVMGNLLDNAMRHSKDATGEGRAEVRVRVDRRQQQCVIDVYDDGQGVASGDVGRLFEPFFTKSDHGSGLGLYLCRELCELNQARIAYAPTSEGRSRFQITVEMQEP
ncbi:MAG: HAMP domain-containing sensor histidine kinase [Pseudomonadota bacterium]